MHVESSIAPLVHGVVVGAICNKKITFVSCTLSSQMMFIIYAQYNGVCGWSLEHKSATYHAHEIAKHHIFPNYEHS